MTRTQQRAAVEGYLADVRRIRATGAATSEQSYYPAVNALLGSLGQSMRPRRLVLSNPAGIDGDFPDVALYDEASIVLALPAEAKPASTAIAALAASAQARRYARTFGGGRVLLTNLRSFALAELNPAGTALTITDSVDLAGTEGELDAAIAVSDAMAGSLAMLVEAGSSVHATVSESHRQAPRSPRACRPPLREHHVDAARRLDRS